MLLAEHTEFPCTENELRQHFARDMLLSLALSVCRERIVRDFYKAERICAHRTIERLRGQIDSNQQLLAAVLPNEGDDAPLIRITEPFHFA